MKLSNQVLQHREIDKGNFMPDSRELSGRLLNRPLLMEPRHASVVLIQLSKELGISKLKDVDGNEHHLQVIESSAVQPQSMLSRSRDRGQPYQLINGIAVIPVNGSLYHKWGWIGSYSAGYDEILRWLELAIGDPAVEGVLFDFDSPGGEVAGCFDCADRIASLRGKKPFWGICNDMNASAAFALASAMDRRLITQTGIAGSVGVVMAHFSYQQFLQDSGIEVTLIHAGAHKVDGNRYENLPKEVLKGFQEETEDLRIQFAELVARNIGIKVKDVLNTEAATFRGQEAISAGLADDLVNGNEAIQLFSDHLSTKGRTLSIGATMPKESGATPEKENTPTKAVGESGASSVVAGADEAPPASGHEEAQHERNRIQGILNHANAEGRSKLASHIAFNTGMSIEEAGEMLAASEQEVDLATDTQTALDAVMDRAENPNIGADTGSTGSSPSENKSTVESMLADWRKAKGIKNDD